MKSKIGAILVAMLLAAFIVPATWAQCVPSYPDVIEVGTSHCIQLCPGSYVIIELDGPVIGPDGLPVLIMQAGCQTQYCNTECTPIDPPAGLDLGGDPFYPDDYYGESDCLIIYMHWIHDGVWTIEIFSFCQGCFCITYDHQLAVELSSFTAVPGDGKVTLNWITASESNNDHFEIQRNEELVAQVQATNNATGSTYTYTDEGLINGQSYAYTLLSVNMDGASETVGTVNARPNASSSVVTSYALYQNYPNPFNPETSIAFDLVEAGDVKLAIYNVLGENVTTLISGPMSSGHHTVIFNGSQLSSGLYLYKLDVNGFSNTKKLVLLK